MTTTVRRLVVTGLRGATPSEFDQVDASICHLTEMVDMLVSFEYHIHVGLEVGQDEQDNQRRLAAQNSAIRKCFQNKGYLNVEVRG